MRNALCVGGVCAVRCVTEECAQHLVSPQMGGCATPCVMGGDVPVHNALCQGGGD